MALLDITQIDSGVVAIEALASAVATNGAPTGTAGIAAQAVRDLLGTMPSSLRVAIISTAGSGVMTATLRLWQRMGALGWVMAKALNAGSALAETSPDSINYSEDITTPNTADRFYLEITAIGGTLTAVKGLLVVAR